MYSAAAAAAASRQAIKTMAVCFPALRAHSFSDIFVPNLPILQALKSTITTAVTGSTTSASSIDESDRNLYGMVQHPPFLHYVNLMLLSHELGLSLHL